MKPKTPKSPTPFLATKHKDKRANIPTEELRDFVVDETPWTPALSNHGEFGRLAFLEIRDPLDAQSIIYAALPVEKIRS